MKAYYAIAHIYFDAESPDDANDMAHRLIETGTLDTTASYLVVAVRPMIRRLYSSRTEIRIPAGSSAPAGHNLQFPMRDDGTIACRRCGRFITASEWAKPCPGQQEAS